MVEAVVIPFPASQLTSGLPCQNDRMFIVLK